MSSKIAPIFIILFISGLQAASCTTDLELMRLTSLGSICGSGISDVVYGKLLGAGSFGQVYVDGSNPKQVIKVSKFGKDDDQKMRSVLREVNAMNCLAESGAGGYVPFTAPCRFVLEQGRGYTVLFFMPLMAAGTLSSLMSNQDAVMSDNSWRMTTMKLLLGGLSNIHSAGLIHRDIKPDNIMFYTKTLDQPYFIDFGFAIRAETSNDPLGTPGYTAPEIKAIIDYDPSARKKGAPRVSFNYGPKVDVFSLGVVFLQMWNNGQGLRTDARTGDYIIPDLSRTKIPADVQRLITSMLTLDPASRPTLDTLIGFASQMRGRVVI